jgi:hypothetical protein
MRERAVIEDNRIRMGSTLLCVYEMHDPERTITWILGRLSSVNTSSSHSCRRAAKTALGPRLNP